MNIGDVPIRDAWVRGSGWVMNRRDNFLLVYLVLGVLAMRLQLGLELVPEAKEVGDEPRDYRDSDAGDSRTHEHISSE